MTILHMIIKSAAPPHHTEYHVFHIVYYLHIVDGDDNAKVVMLSCICTIIHLGRKFNIPHLHTPCI